MFWSSVDLTGNQTQRQHLTSPHTFWSSVDLTGNQTPAYFDISNALFWSSVDLTGNQTGRGAGNEDQSFGAVSI